MLIAEVSFIIILDVSFIIAEDESADIVVVESADVVLELLLQEAATKRIEAAIVRCLIFMFVIFVIIYLAKIVPRIEIFKFFLQDSKCPIVFHHNENESWMFLYSVPSINAL